jgi:hypothetical protein
MADAHLSACIFDRIWEAAVARRFATGRFAALTDSAEAADDKAVSA